MSQEQNQDMSQYFYRASAVDFMKIPGSPVAYWVSSKTRDAFEKGLPFRNIGNPRVGMQTSNNGKYLRFWFEINYSELEEKSENPTWIKYIKGGSFRRWYGNLEHLLHYRKNPNYILSQKNATLLPIEMLKKPKGTWTDLTSGKFNARIAPDDSFHDISGHCFYPKRENLGWLLAYANSKVFDSFLSIINSSFHFQVGDVGKIPILNFDKDFLSRNTDRLLAISKYDWDRFETSWDFSTFQIIFDRDIRSTIFKDYMSARSEQLEQISETRRLEIENNHIFIDAYSLHDELDADVPLSEVSLNCNPHYRYGGNRSEEELETLLQCDTLRELVSYAIGCMMGRYSLDKPGLILASQGETLQDYLRQIPTPRFAPDDDAILPLTDQEWFADDATNRFREFIRVVWGDEHLQENLDFVAESLCLHAIKPKRGESALDTIRRYLSTQFFKDHLRTYKKRPIYWLFSSGKHKAFECLVYLHRYHEGTLARMRTEYVIPLTAKLNTYAVKLENDIEASTSTAEKKRLEKELAALHNQQAELATFDEKLRHYADQRISLDLDDGVKVNYGKFGDLLAEFKAVAGDKSADS